MSESVVPAKNQESNLALGWPSVARHMGTTRPNILTHPSDSDTMALPSTIFVVNEFPLTQGEGWTVTKLKDGTVQLQSGPKHASLGFTLNTKTRITPRELVVEPHTTILVKPQQNGGYEVLVLSPSEKAAQKAEPIRAEEPVQPEEPPLIA